MTQEEAIKQLNKLVANGTGDPHIEADSILCQFLDDNGYEEIADAYREADNRIDFWYE